MFKLKVNDTFDWPVKFDVPVGGKHQQESFTATFIRPTSEQMEQLAPVPGETPAEANARVCAFMESVVVTLDLEVLDAQNQPITDVAVKKQLVLADPTIGVATLAALMEGLSGRKRKN